MSAVKRIVNAAKPDDGDLDDDGGLAVAPHAGIAARPKLLDCRCPCRPALQSHQFILSFISICKSF